MKRTYIKPVTETTDTQMPLILAGSFRVRGNIPTGDNAVPNSGKLNSEPGEASDGEEFSKFHHNWNLWEEGE